VAALVEVVIGAIYVRRDNACEVAAVLLTIGATRDLKHALCIRIAVVCMVWRSVVELMLVDGIGRIIREDACRET